jgi:hypothetical protein
MLPTAGVANRVEHGGYLTYIITTRRMTSGELLKYRNGLLIAWSYHGERHRGYFV